MKALKSNSRVNEIILPTKIQKSAKDKYQEHLKVLDQQKRSLESVIIEKEMTNKSDESSNKSECKPKSDEKDQTDTNQAEIHRGSFISNMSDTSHTIYGSHYMTEPVLEENEEFSSESCHGTDS